MKTSSKSMGLRKAIAAFGLAALTSLALAPAAFAVDAPSVTDGTPVDDSASEGQATSDTEIWLVVTDKGAKTMSVTAPLKIYLATEVDSTVTDWDKKQYNFEVPTTAAARITNNSLNREVKLAGYAVEDANSYGHVKVSTEETDGKGFYKKGTTEFIAGTTNNIETAVASQNHYWLQSAIENQGKSATLELVSSGTVPTDADAAAALKMAKNNDTGDALYSYLPLQLSGQIYGPDKSAVSGFGQEDGAQVSVVTWTFQAVDD